MGMQGVSVRGVPVWLFRKHVLGALKKSGSFDGNSGYRPHERSVLAFVFSFVPP